MSDTQKRPLSPHLQIYRPQITSILSILHRITGFGLVIGAGIATWWLMAIVIGADAYRIFYDLAASFFGQLILFGLLWAACYHLLNGIRYLFWSVTIGINMKSVAISGWLVVLGSMAMSGALWILKIN